MPPAASLLVHARADVAAVITCLYPESAVVAATCHILESGVATTTCLVLESIVMATTCSYPESIVAARARLYLKNAAPTGARLQAESTIAVSTFISKHSKNAAREAPEPNPSFSSSSLPRAVQRMPPRCTADKGEY